MAHIFGVRNGRLTAGEIAECDKAAKKHDAKFVYVKLPEGPRSWFTSRSYGHPFDGATQDAVLAELGDWFDEPDSRDVHHEFPFPCHRER